MPMAAPHINVVPGVRVVRATPATSGPVVWPSRAAPTQTAITAPRWSSGDASTARSCRVGMRDPSQAP